MPEPRADHLAELARYISRIGYPPERRLVRQIRAVLLPVLEYLIQERDLRRHEGLLIALINHINDITSGLATHLQLQYSLSIGELRVALMIKSGMKNNEIARCLNISNETVKTYRRNIRKKLQITGTGQNLQGYLQSFAPC